MFKKIFLLLIIACAVLLVLALVLSNDRKAGREKKRQNNQVQLATGNSAAVPAGQVAAAGAGVAPGVVADAVAVKTDLVRQVEPAVPFAWSGRKLSPQLELVLGMNGQEPSPARMQAIHALGKDLQDYEQEALLQFLRCKYRYKEDVYAVKNDILDALIAQNIRPAGLGADLVAMARDKDYESCWREFCVQHFEVFYRTMWPVAGAGDSRVNDAGRGDIQAAYRDAAGETDSGIAGAALLGMERLSGDYPEYDRSWIAARAVAVASSKETDLRSIISAVQVAGKMGRSEILPLARELVQSAPDQSMPLRLAAIGALGSIGNSSDLVLLETMTGSSDRYVQKAADYSFKRLQQKLANAGGGTR